jgi:hypothetical protein
VRRDLAIEDVVVAMGAMHAEDIVPNMRAALHAADHMRAKVPNVREDRSGRDGGVANDELQGKCVVLAEQEQVHFR